MRNVRQLHHPTVCFLISQSLLLASLSSLQAQPPRKPSNERQPAASAEKHFDVEGLFRRSIVIDGTVNYYSTTTGSGIGQPNFNSGRTSGFGKN